MMSEVEKKLALVRQAGKGLLVRGDLIGKLRTDVPELNPAAILDQSGYIVMVRHFPNIFFNFSGPEALVGRNTLVVVKNPRVDTVESVLRQSLVLTGDFFAFSQAYVKATVEKLQNALKGPVPQLQVDVQDAEKGKKKKKP